MRTKLSRFALPICLSVSCVLLAGCEDAASRGAAEASDTLATQRAELDRISRVGVVAGAEDFDAMRSRLMSVVSSLDGASDGSDGQRGSAKLLASNAHRQIANMDLSDAGLVQDSISRVHSELFAQIRSMDQLMQAAANTESFSENLDREHLDRERANWGARLRNAQEQLERLADPINQLESGNSSESDRVRVLRDEANSLLRRAKDLGKIEGQATFENSVARRRDADRIEFAIANNEAELMFQLEPQQAWADMQAEGAQEIIETIDRAKREFAALEQDLRNGFISDTRAAASELLDTIQARLSEVQSLIDSRFEPSLASALEHADRAISKAGAAAASMRGEGAVTAKVAKAQSQALKASILWSKARVAANQLELIQQFLAMADGQSNVGAMGSQVEKLTTMRDTSLQEARAAYGEAQQTLQNVGGTPSREVDALTQTIGLTLRSLDGEAADFGNVNTGGRGASMPRGGASSAAGFNSANELVSFMQTVRANDVAAMERLFSAFDATTPSARRAIRFTREMVQVMGDLQQAIQGIDPSGALYEQFNAGMSDADGPLFTSVRLTESDANSGTIVVNAASSPSGPEEMPIIKKGGSWMIEFGDEQLGALSLGGSGSIDDEIEQAEGMLKAIRGIVAGIENGTITSAEDLRAAFMQMMMESMQGSGSDFGA